MAKTNTSSAAAVLRVRNRQSGGSAPYARRRELTPLPGNGAPTQDRKTTYALLLAYYNGQIFDKLSEWTAYKGNYGLYRYIRSIYNPVARIVDFYVDQIYPGIIGDDSDLPAGVTSGIPLHPNTDQKVKDGLFQFWKWSNWQVQQAQMVLYAALTGNCLVELIDDLQKNRVSARVVWPGYVNGIDLDSEGLVNAYEIEYPVVEADGRTWSFKKIVTKDEIIKFRDGQVISQVPNPYPFVPAVWVKHLDIGNDFGTPAIRNIAKFDELNSLMSHVLDHIHKQIKSPRIMWSSGQIVGLFKGQEDNVYAGDFDERQNVPMLKGPEGGNTETLVGNLEAQTIVPIIGQIIDELNNEYPEITLYQKLRDQNIVTGPSARQLVGDVVRKVQRPATNYDLASVRLFKMALSVGGWRANNGDWGPLNKSQQKFTPFEINDWDDGDIEIIILPREIIRESSKDQADELYIRAQAVSQVAEFITTEQKLEYLGVRPEDIAPTMRLLEKERNEGWNKTNWDVEELKSETQIKVAEIRAGGQVDAAQAQADGQIKAAQTSAETQKQIAKTNANKPAMPKPASMPGNPAPKPAKTKGGLTSTKK